VDRLLGGPGAGEPLVTCERLPRFLRLSLPFIGERDGEATPERLPEYSP
jgi:hypothetical protein